jgi:alginate O-acetyltransferase complex protein AlgI
MNYGLGKLILRSENKKRKNFLILGIILNILLLGFFKYTDFFIGNINIVFQQDISPLNLLLPLALSFCTFQQISYLVDLYRNEGGSNDFYSYILFVTFFPHLISGPIVLHNELMPQFEDPEKKKIIFSNIGKGLFIFMIGLTKKFVIADTLAIWANDGYSNYAALTSFESWTTSLAYTFQLYYDFSGYCDMAIGIALLFNIKLPANFNSPYKARNITEFWHRWHMTLSGFLTKYLYIPLGGSRKGKYRTYINIFLVFLISGFWHGAGWTFIIWVIIHGLASIIVRVWGKTIIRLPFLFSWLITFLFVNFAWVYFRAENMTVANTIIKKMILFDIDGTKTFLYGLSQNFNSGKSLILLGINLSNPVFIISFIIISFLCAILFKNSIELLDKWKPNNLTLFHTQFMLIVVLLVLFYFQKSSEFLYFNF